MHGHDRKYFSNTVHLTFSSDGSSKGGGYLSTEDSQGSAETIFLEEGFLDFLNKVHTD